MSDRYEIDNGPSFDNELDASMEAVRLVLANERPGARVMHNGVPIMLVSATFTTTIIRHLSVPENPGMGRVQGGGMTSQLSPDRESPMKFELVRDPDLNAKQRGARNFHKVAAVLSDYGFNCMRRVGVRQGADFLAYHKDGTTTLRVQLKTRLTIDRKYIGKGLYIAFPVRDSWCLIEHDVLVDLVGATTNWLNTRSWRDRGTYNSHSPNPKLLKRLDGHVLKDP